jgi:cation diffusion facilitator CzcD-associated flavoprotein CzcO
MNYMAQFTPNGANFQYRDEEKEAFKDPAKLFEYRIKLERTSNGIFKNLVPNETRQDVKKALRANIEKLMRERLHNDEVMMSKLTPSYQPWCHRLTPGDAYLEALQADNAALIE